MAVILVFAGEYDLACQKELRRELQRVYAEPNVVLDFSEVTYIDSSCITELLLLNRARRESGFERESILLPNGSGATRRVFEVAGLTKVFNVIESLDADAGDIVARAVVR
jgi:anti-anti-sigma factor